MSRVFVVQRPVYKDPATGRWADKYDLSPAAHFGRLVECLPVGNIPSDVGVTIRTLEEALADYSAGDYLLAVGDPLAIAIAVLVAGRRPCGVVNLLKWDRRHQEYHAHSVQAA